MSCLVTAVSPVARLDCENYAVVCLHHYNMSSGHVLFANVRLSLFDSSAYDRLFIRPSVVTLHDKLLFANHQIQ